MMTGAALAQPAVQPPMAAPPLVDWTKVEIKATDLGNNTWMLTGQGGNITIAVGSDAIIMVDGQFAPLSEKIKAAIKAISPLPIKYLVNTISTVTTLAATRTSPRTARPSWRTTTSVCGSRPEPYRT